MIRFASSDEGVTTKICVAGRLEGEHLPELSSHCAEARHAVVFDLSQLQSADDASIRWLCGQMAQGRRVTGASPYIQLRLERAMGRT